MKQECTEKLKKYQDKDYELFLKEKGVLDARQFLHASLLYLNYAIITEKLYSDIGKKNIEEGGKENPFYNSVEILGWHYNAHTILNKLTLEWTSHISNALDCILQYVNSALNLGIEHRKVGITSVTKKLSRAKQCSVRLMICGMMKMLIIFARSITIQNIQWGCMVIHPFWIP